MPKQFKILLSVLLLAYAVKADNGRFQTSILAPVDPIINTLPAPVDVPDVVPNITDPASVVMVVESVISQADGNISVPVASDVVPMVDPSVITVIPDILPDPSMIAPETNIDQVNVILDLLQSMAQSFNNDIPVYQGICQDLHILLTHFDSTSAKRRGFVNTIINLFSGSQSTIEEMERNYQALFAQYSLDMSVKNAEIHALENQIKKIQEEVSLEKTSMMDVIVQLNNNLDVLQSSYDLLSVVNGINIGSLVQSLQQLSDSYNDMTQEREQLLSLLDELKDQLPL